MNSRYRQRAPVSACFLPGKITKPGIVIGNVEYGKFYLTVVSLAMLVMVFVPFLWPCLAFQIWYEIHGQKKGATAQARWRDQQEIKALRANQRA